LIPARKVIIYLGYRHPFSLRMKIARFMRFIIAAMMLLVIFG
jgi:hypothetical protein